MTLAELIARVQKNVGDPNGRVWHTDKLVDLINEAMLDVTVLIERVDPTFLSETESLSQAGGNADVEIDLPTDLRRVINVVRTDTSANRQVKLVPMNQIFMYRGVDIGEVAYVRAGIYTIAGAAITTYKEAAMSLLGFLDLATGTTYTYTLYYAKRPPEVSAVRTGWVPQIPEEFHPLLAIRTTVKALAQENKSVDAYMKLWTEGVQMMLQALPSRDGQATMIGAR